MGLKPSAIVDHRIRVMDARRWSEPCDPDAPSGAEAPEDTSHTTSRGLTGQGPAGFHRPAPPVWCRPRAARRRELHPNPIRSDTSCRAIGAHQRESLVQHGHRCLPPRSESGTSGYGTPPTITPRGPFPGPTWPRDPLSRGQRGPRAASPGPPRRGPRSAAPEVPSIDEPPGPEHLAFARYVGREGPYPQIVTNLWKTHGAVAQLRATGRPTLRPGCLDGRPAAWAWSSMRHLRCGGVGRSRLRYLKILEDP